MAGTLPQVLRSDARANRDRVLEAARELFAQQGLGVTMRQVARHARVGPATLYRRFPTKDALVHEAMRDEIASCRAIVREAVADPDPWHGLRRAVEGLLVLNAGNQGFTDAFLATRPDALDLTAHRTGLLRGLATVLRRAKASGAVRPDVVVDDVLLVLLATRGLATLPAQVRTPAARRLALLVLRGFAVVPDDVALTSPARLAPIVVAPGRSA